MLGQASKKAAILTRLDISEDEFCRFRDSFAEPCLNSDEVKKFLQTSKFPRQWVEELPITRFKAREARRQLFCFQNTSFELVLCGLIDIMELLWNSARPRKPGGRAAVTAPSRNPSTLLNYLKTVNPSATLSPCTMTPPTSTPLGPLANIIPKHDQEHLQQPSSFLGLEDIYFEAYVASYPGNTLPISLSDITMSAPDSKSHSIDDLSVVKLLQHLAVMFNFDTSTQYLRLRTLTFHKGIPVCSAAILRTAVKVLSVECRGEKMSLVIEQRPKGTAAHEESLLVCRASD